MADSSNETTTLPPTTLATGTVSTTVDTAPPSHSTATTQSSPGVETIIPVILVLAAVAIAFVVACIIFRRRQVRRKKHFSRQLEMTNRRIRAIGVLKARAEHELASWPHQNTPDQFAAAGEMQSAVVSVRNATPPPSESSMSSIPHQPRPMRFPVEVRSIQRRHSANTLNIPQVVCSLGSIAAQGKYIQRHSSDYFLSTANPAVRGLSNRFSRLRIADSAFPADAGNEAHIMTDTEVKVASHTATQGSSFAQVESSNVESFYPSSACESPCWSHIDPSKVGVVVRERWTGTPLASETSTMTDSQTYVSSHVTHQSEKWV